MTTCNGRSPGWVKAAGLVLLLAASTAPAQATTWTIEYDPASPDGQIGRLVDTVASGDTILIGPGEYCEHILVSEGKSLTLIGRDGSQTTVLDGECYAERELSILYSGPPFGERAGTLTLRGLTFKRGAGAHDWIRVCGGAVYWARSEGVAVTDCQFKENRTVEGTGYGGGLYIEATRATLEGCYFVGNDAFFGGGAWLHAVQEATVRNCTFDVAAVGSASAAVDVSCGGSVVIERNEVTQSPNDNGTACISVWGPNVRVTNNRIVSLASHPGNLLYWNISGYGSPVDPIVDVSNNLFWTAGRDQNSVQVLFHMFDQYDHATSTFTMHDNAFIHTAVTVDQVPSGLDVSRNLFYESPLDVCLSAGTVRCSVSWPDSFAVRASCPWHQMTFEQVLVANPQLCSDLPGSIEVAETSPCLGSDELPGCGVIGGVTIGCSMTPTRSTSWGRIKNRFR